MAIRRITLKRLRVRIDEEVARIMKTAHDRASKILS
jgi:hypothetical protein